MALYAQHGIPVGVNEPHHRGMPDAPDVVYVVSGYLSAYNASASWVRDYIAQLIFSPPSGVKEAAGLAKMLAVFDLIALLAEADSRIWRQTRTELLSYPLDPDVARHTWPPVSSSSACTWCVSCSGACSLWLATLISR